MRILASALLVAVLASVPGSLLANDAAAALGTGGLQLRSERRVTMKKERLYIGSPPGHPPDRLGTIGLVVRVDYEFVNEGSEDVSTEVAFPIPPLRYKGESLGPTARFDKFRVWVDGREVVPGKEVRASLDGRDVTTVLNSAGVFIENYGGFRHDDQAGSDAFRRLPREKHEILVREGLIDEESDFPRWLVGVTYHWPQRFPAGKMVKVRHEYNPAWGTEGATVSSLGKKYADGCFDRATVDALGRRIKAREGRYAETGDYIPLVWVDYILTTANTWKTPILDFELVVERPQDWQASFCWDGKVEKVGKTRFRATAKNFIPARDLRVYFYPR